MCVYIQIYMCVCACVCVYIYLYVCIYVCMYVHIYEASQGGSLFPTKKEMGEKRIQSLKT